MFRKKVLRRVCRFDFPMHWARNSARDVVSTMCSNGFYMVNMRKDMVDMAPFLMASHSDMTYEMI